MVTRCVVASTVPGALACGSPARPGWVTCATYRVSVMGSSRDLVVPDLRTPSSSPLWATEPQLRFTPTHKTRQAYRLGTTVSSFRCLRQCDGGPRLAAS